MKWISILVVALVTFSCKKDSGKSQFLGKWRLVAYYTGPACGCWYQVQPMNADILEFKVDAKYTITRAPIYSSNVCPGRYRIINVSTVGLREECAGSNPSPEAIGIYSESLKELTIEYNYPTPDRAKYRYVKL